MQDGPEEAEGTYEHAGHSYRLREEESEKWRVFDGDRYLGVLIAVRGRTANRSQQQLARDICLARKLRCGHLWHGLAAQAGRAEPGPHRRPVEDPLMDSA